MRSERERTPKGSRHHWRLILAVGAAILACWAYYHVRDAGPAGRGLLVLSVVLTMVTVGLGWLWQHRTPFDISARLPWRLTVWARMGWYERAFLGWSYGWLHEPRFAMGTVEDSVGVVGPTRVNKTAGIGITQAAMWGGPLISVAPKPQMFRKTAARRRLLAKWHGGRVMIYAPSSEGKVEGLTPVRFSPCDSTDPNVVQLRVLSWIEAAGTGKSVENKDHWQSGAARILRGCFLAAAHHRLRPGDFSLIREWLADSEAGLEEPIQILRDLRTYEGDQWATELAGVKKTPPRERGSFFSAAEKTVEATSNPRVLRSTAATDFDAEEFLLSRSTLYVVSPTEHQKAVAPLLSMLIEAIVHTAYRLHREDRLPARLGVSLDDLANCAPLPQLESIISQGAGQGVNVFWSLQSLAQLRDHYGIEQAEAIWSATRCKIVFGGLVDERSLDRLSTVIGDEKVKTTSTSWSIPLRLRSSSDDDGKRQETHGSTWRPLLAPSQLRRIRDGWAMLLYHNLEPRMLREPLAEKRRTISRHLLPWAIAEAEIEKVIVEPELEPEPEEEAA